MSDLTEAPAFLFAYANDRTDQRYLRKLPEERRRTKKALRRPVRAKRCETIVCPDATIDDVLEECQESQSRLAVFHFAGHADGKTLLFEGTGGEGGLAEATTLATFLGDLRGLKLVVLNGCATANQVDALLAANVPAVIATSTAIRDDVATDFASHFYVALGRGATIQDSYEQATAAVRLIHGNGAQEQRDLVRGLVRDIASETAVSEWPWGLHGAEVARRQRLVVAGRSPLWPHLIMAVAWATAAAVAIFLGVTLYHWLSKSSGQPHLTTSQTGILALALGVLIAVILLCLVVLQSRLPSDRR